MNRGSKHNYGSSLVPGTEDGLGKMLLMGFAEWDHLVTTPALSGLDERRHSGLDADLETHVLDVLAHIEMECINDITLVGWSYGGWSPRVCGPVLTEPRKTIELLLK